MIGTTGNTRQVRAGALYLEKIINISQENLIESFHIIFKFSKLGP